MVYSSRGERAYGKRKVLESHPLWVALGRFAIDKAVLFVELNVNGIFDDRLEDGLARLGGRLVALGEELRQRRPLGRMEEELVAVP